MINYIISFSSLLTPISLYYSFCSFATRVQSNPLKIPLTILAFNISCFTLLPCYAVGQASLIFPYPYTPVDQFMIHVCYRGSSKQIHLQDILDSQSFLKSPHLPAVLPISALGTFTLICQNTNTHLQFIYISDTLLHHRNFHQGEMPPTLPLNIFHSLPANILPPSLLISSHSTLLSYTLNTTFHILF